MEFKHILPLTYVLVAIADIGFDISDYSLIITAISPFAWLNIFQNEQMAPLATVLSITLWYGIGYFIDKKRN
ncbi:hypothetical protein FJZ22_02890 [Candidatus Pacearchaeota archaeon]|nr:hypothetical protein [Candidatus Pacearchaeota archaeon]